MTRSFYERINGILIPSDHIFQLNTLENLLYLDINKKVSLKYFYCGTMKGGCYPFRKVLFPQQLNIPLSKDLTTLKFKITFLLNTTFVATSRFYSEI